MKNIFGAFIILGVFLSCSLSIKDDKDAGATITTNKTASIEGYVFSHDSLMLKKTTIPSSATANVVLELQLDGKIIKKDISDESGYFKFENLAGGIYSIIARFDDGVISIRGNIVLSDKAEASIKLDIHVGPGAVKYLSSQEQTSSSSIGTASSPAMSDSRNGKTYRVIRVGTRTWMAENLDFEIKNGSWCYENNQENCETYGRLYDWETAQNACPDGWNLPSDEEYMELVRSVGGLEFASYRLKANSPLWYGSGEDVIHFSVLPAGYYENGGFYNLGGYGDFWTSDEYDDENGKNFHFDYYNASLKRGWYHKVAGLSVRCIQYQESQGNSSTSGQLTDSRDDQTYPTVIIGNQEWMAQNLNYAKSQSWCYNSDSEMCRTFGRLYSWESSKTACPEGWNLPSDDDFTTMTDFIGGLETASFKLKSTSNLWKSGGYGADEYGFNVLPAGYYEDGVSSNLYGYADFWTSTSYDSDSAWNRHFDYYNESLKRGSYHKVAGLSVRCMRYREIAQSSQGDLNNSSSSNFSSIYNVSSSSIQKVSSGKAISSSQISSQHASSIQTSSSIKTSSQQTSSMQSSSFTKTSSQQNSSIQTSSSIAAPSSSSQALSSSLLQSSSTTVFWNTSISYGEMRDSRDEKTYRTVQIGEQVWMAENLNFTTASGSWCYDYQKVMCDLYGRLYYWETALDVCPDGWHLPDDAEFTVLTDFIGGLQTAALKLKAKTTLWWGYTAEDTYGFSTLPAGYYEDGGFDNLNGYGDFWTSSTYDDLDAWNRHFDYYNEFLKRGTYHKLSALSVRCLKD